MTNSLLKYLKINKIAVSYALVACSFTLEVNAESPIHEGFYMGINAGYSETDIKLKCSNCDPAYYTDMESGDSLETNIHEGFLGLHGGYNFYKNDLLYGIEASYLNTNAREKSWSGIESGDDTFTSKLESILLASVRFGKKFDEFVIYGKTGLAFGDYSLRIQDYNLTQDGIDTGNSIGGGSDRQWFTGASLGFGAEYMISKNVGLGAEYNYIWFQSRKVNSGGTQLTGPLAGEAVPYKMKNDMDVQLLQFNLNYHF